MDRGIKIKNNKINWICLKDKCTANCCGSFDDRNQIYDKLYLPCFKVGHETIFLTPEDGRKIKSKENKKFIETLKGGEMRIKLNKDNSCPFLKKGSCSIYSIRPQLCRAYPFYLDISSGLNVDIFCPGIGKGWTNVEGIKRYINSMNKVYLRQIGANRKKLFKK